MSTLCLDAMRVRSMECICKDLSAAFKQALDSVAVTPNLPPHIVTCEHCSMVMPSQPHPKLSRLLPMLLHRLPQHPLTSPSPHLKIPLSALGVHSPHSLESSRS